MHTHGEIACKNTFVWLSSLLPLRPHLSLCHSHAKAYMHSRTHISGSRRVAPNGNAFQPLPHLIFYIAFSLKRGALCLEEYSFCRLLSQHSHLLEGHISPLSFREMLAHYFSFIPFHIGLSHSYLVKRDEEGFMWSSRLCVTCCPLDEKLMSRNTPACFTGIFWFPF